MVLGDDYTIAVGLNEILSRFAGILAMLYSSETISYDYMWKFLSRQGGIPFLFCWDEIIPSTRFSLWGKID